MKIIGITGQKGGSGKTTLAVNLSAWFTLKGLKTVLVDRDPQSAAEGWDKMGKGLPFPILSDLRAKLGAALSFRRESGDQVAVVDTAPSIGGAFREIPQYADLIILPSRPTGIDLRSVINSIQVLKEEFPDKAYWVVLTQLYRHFRVTRDSLEALEELNIPYFKTRIGFKAVYQSTYTEGETVFSGRKNAAAEEITNLGNEIAKLLQLRIKKK
jgi:chromosome partitioning protein